MPPRALAPRRAACVCLGMPGSHRGEGTLYPRPPAAQHMRNPPCQHPGNISDARHPLATVQHMHRRPFPRLWLLPSTDWCSPHLLAPFSRNLKLVRTGRGLGHPLHAMGGHHPSMRRHQPAHAAAALYQALHRREGPGEAAARARGDLRVDLRFPYMKPTLTPTPPEPNPTGPQGGYDEGRRHPAQR
jgi:hypothetical protein